MGCAAPHREASPSPTKRSPRSSTGRGWGLYAPMRADAWSGRSWTNGGIRPEERAEAMATLQAAVTGANPTGSGC